MRKNILVIILFLGSMSTIIGQEKINALEIADYQNKKMIRILELDDDQTIRTKEINLKYAEKITALIASEGSMFGKIGEMRKIKKLKNEELKKVLSAKQIRVYEEDLEPKFREHFKKQMKH